MRSFTITLPWPDSRLTPNAKRRVHWTRYVKPAKAARFDTCNAVRAVIGRHRFAAPPAVEVHFYPPDARHRDDDGMIGAFKHARDGIADAIRHDDSTWRPTYHFHPPHQPDGKVVVVLTEGADG